MILGWGIYPVRIQRMAENVGFTTGIQFSFFFVVIFAHIKDSSKNMKIMILQQVFKGFGRNVYQIRILRMAENFGFTMEM